MVHTIAPPLFEKHDISPQLELKKKERRNTCFHNFHFQDFQQKTIISIKEEERSSTPKRHFLCIIVFDNFSFIYICVFSPSLPRRHEALPLLLLLMITNGTSPNGMYKYSRIRAANAARIRHGHDQRLRPTKMVRNQDCLRAAAL